MPRRGVRVVTIVVSAIVCALAGGDAQARPAESTLRYSFNVPGSFGATAKTAGALVIGFSNAGPSDGCHELAVELKVDGGAPQTYVVRPGSGISPLLAPQRRGERTVELQTRLTRPCTPSTPIQGSLSITVSEDGLTKGQLSFVERTNALKRALHPAAISLAARRNGVEAALEAAGERTYRALERKHAITDLQIQAAAADRTIARRLEYLHRAQPLRIDIAPDELAAIRSVGNHLADLERRAVAAARGGGQPRVFDARIKQLRAQMLVLETRLDARRSSCGRGFRLWMSTSATSASPPAGASSSTCRGSGPSTSTCGSSRRRSTRWSVRSRRLSRRASSSRRGSTPISAP